jgi:hypothetical protein
MCDKARKHELKQGTHKFQNQGSSTRQVQPVPDLQPNSFSLSLHTTSGNAD